MKTILSITLVKRHMYREIKLQSVKWDSVVTTKVNLETACDVFCANYNSKLQWPPPMTRTICNLKERS